ncbi:MAG: MerR family DNA-binding transcriptional regulator [Candidatus Limnocylindria bacterium]
MSDDDLLPIGRFARLCGLTVGALRHYHELGVLLPAEVDPETGYRRYRASQLADARLVARLRELELPLPEVRAILGAPEAERRRLLAGHRSRLMALLARTHRQIHWLTRAVDHEEPIMTTPAAAPDLADRRQLAVDLFNHVWTLLERTDRSAVDDDEMLHAAHASCFHWGQVGEPVNRVRGEWQCSRVYATLGRAEPALWHARRSLALCEEYGIADFDLAFAHEAIARALRLDGDRAGADASVARARAAAEAIAEDEDRELLLSDLETV